MKKVGRPLKADKRTREIRVRVTEDEYLQMINFCDKCGIFLSGLVRSSVRKNIIDFESKFGK